jgi:hypothetical protein
MHKVDNHAEVNPTQSEVKDDSLFGNRREQGFSGWDAAA